NVFVNGLGGADTFNVGDGVGNLSFINYALSIDGGDESDTIVVTQDTNFALNDALLFIGGTAINLTSVEIANLTGGASANAFDVSDWTGTGTIDGVGGADIVAAAKDEDFTASD